VNNDRNDSAKELIAKYLAGETSTAEEKELLGWIAESRENESHYLKAKKVFELAQRHYQSATNPDINLDQEWDHFVNTINSRKKKTIQLNTGEKTVNLWFRMAAAILLLVVSGGIIYYFATKDNDVHYQSADQTLHVELPDGSLVTLNRNSSLSYTSAFGKDNRIITLEGEAFFDVVRDPQKPFLIKTSEVSVEVLGTSFNVEAYDSLEEIKVVVESGVVRFVASAIKEEVELTAGKQATYVRESRQLTSGENEDVNFQSWSTRKIIFDGEDLHSVIETLNKTYHVNIVLSADVPATCAVTVTFDNQSLESVLHVLESTLNLTYRINGDQIEITDAGC